MGAAIPIQAALNYAAIHRLGTLVTADDNGMCTVHCDARAWQARRAASCLLVPQPGDTVLLSGPAAEHVYVIAVLEQADPGHARIETDGDLSIESRQGSVQLHAAHETRLNAAHKVSIEAIEVGVQAARAGCAVRALSYTGQEIDVVARSIRVVGHAYELIMDRIAQLTDHALRLVRETDQWRAGRIDCEAEHTLRLHAEHTLLTGQALVKVDADQIHMG